MVAKSNPLGQWTSTLPYRRPVAVWVGREGDMAHETFLVLETIILSTSQRGKVHLGCTSSRNFIDIRIPASKTYIQPFIPPSLSAHLLLHPKPTLAVHNSRSHSLAHSTAPSGCLTFLPKSHICRDCRATRQLDAPVNIATTQLDRTYSYYIGLRKLH